MSRVESHMEGRAGRHPAVAAAGRDARRRAVAVGALAIGTAALLAACSSVRVGVGLPIGRIGGASVSVGSDGSVGGTVGVGSGGVSVGVGASGRLPEKKTEPAQAQSADAPASAASAAQAASASGR